MSSYRNQRLLVRVPQTKVHPGTTQMMATLHDPHPPPNKNMSKFNLRDAGTRTARMGVGLTRSHGSYRPRDYYHYYVVLALPWAHYHYHVTAAATATTATATSQHRDDDQSNW